MPKSFLIYWHLTKTAKVIQATIEGDILVDTIVVIRLEFGYNIKIEVKSEGGELL